MKITTGLDSGYTFIPPRPINLVGTPKITLVHNSYLNFVLIQVGSMHVDRLRKNAVFFFLNAPSEYISNATSALASLKIHRGSGV